MTDFQVDANQDQLIRDFPDVYCYSKRMAEHLLISQNNKASRPVALVMVRPSIVAAAA